MGDKYFKKGDVLTIRAHHSDKGKGLSYKAMKVTAGEEGRSGGWDVYDGTDESGEEISFYGFSVDSVKKGKKAESMRKSCNRSLDIIRLAEEDDDKSSYYVLADPKEAEKIKTSKDDSKALTKGSAGDIKSYAKDQLKGKDAVMLKRNPDGSYDYAVGESIYPTERKDGGNDMSRANDIHKLVESAAVNEMYALGADHIVNFLKKTAYERFDVDPSTISVVPWPEDGSDFNIQSPLTKEQYEELSEKITRTYPLYVVEFVGDGVMKFYSGRSVGTEAADTVLPYPREGEAETNAPGTATGQPNPLGRENAWKDLPGRSGYDL
jgi:hypothetical protein